MIRTAASRRPLRITDVPLFARMVTDRVDRCRHMHRLARVRPWHGVVALLALIAIFALFSMTLGSRVVIVNHVGASNRAPK